MIEIKHIKKAYGDTVILEDVNAVINDGDVIAIIGPSGCGKSTLLNCINVLQRATSGQIIFNGVDLMDPQCDLKLYRRKIGMVFQSFNLFGHLTILENAIEPQVTLLKRSRQEACDNAVKYLKMVGMADKMFNYPHQLSGGQKQRAAIARTLSMDPEVLLLDEPTSALDPKMVGEVEYVIKKLVNQGRTMIVVTHEMRLARQISNRIFYMDEKGLYEEGSTEEIFTNPKREKTRIFVNKIKKLELVIDSDLFDYVNAVKEIEQYGDRLELDAKLVRQAQLLFEESCMQGIIPLMGGDVSLKVVYEYSDVNRTLKMTIYHKGEGLIEKIEDPLSLNIIRNLAEIIELEEVSVD